MKPAYQTNTALSATGPSREGRRTARAYTLIELLTVIAIIAVLSSIILSVIPATKSQRIRKAVTAQLAQLELAIENYHAAKGFYPPWTGDPEKNPLYYELVGTTPLNSTVFTVGKNEGSITSAQIRDAFGFDRFLNVAAAGTNSLNDPDKGTYAKKFHANIKPSQVQSNSNGIMFLAVPADGPNGSFNLWRYRCPGQHNPESYTLGAIVVINNKTHIIGNWKQ